MDRLKSIFHRRAKGIPPNDSDASSQGTAIPTSPKLLPPSTSWTKHQLFYVIVMQGFGAFIISGGINFAIAYGMYGNQNVEENPIRLWRLPNTFSGDAAVTIFVQSVITWLITMAMVNGDLRNGKVQAIGFVPEPRNKFLRWYFFLDAEQPVIKKSFGQWVVFILSQIGRALLFAVVLFFLIWPATVGILTSSTIGTHRGNDYYYARRWTPQVYKLILGGIIGLLGNPFFAMMWLLTVGWRELRAQNILPTTKDTPGATHRQLAMTQTQTDLPSSQTPTTMTAPEMQPTAGGSVLAPPIIDRQ